MPAAAVSSPQLPYEDHGRHSLFAWSCEVRDPRSRRLRLAGELDLDGLAELHAALPAADREVEVLVVDLADLDFIDCAAVDCLFGMAERMSHRGGRLRLVGARGQAARLLDLVGPPSRRLELVRGR